MTRKLLLLGTVVGALGFFTAAHADEIWNFNSPVSPPNLGPTHDYAGSGGTIITATAFGPGPPALFGKGLGSDENGVGLTNDLSGDNEITPGSFIQLSLANINFALNSLNMSFLSGSTTLGEAWQVLGTNTSGTLVGATPILSCVGSDGPGNPCETLMTLSGAGTFKFLDVTALTGNVLLSEVNTVPGPIVGAGLPGLVAACAGLLVLARRRRRKIA